MHKTHNVLTVSFLFAKSLSCPCGIGNEELLAGTTVPGASDTDTTIIAGKQPNNPNNQLVS